MPDPITPALTSRREFLRKGALWLGAGLLVGDAALEALDRLTHRKVWAGAEFGGYEEWPLGAYDLITSSSVHPLATFTLPEWSAHYTETDGGKWPRFVDHRCPQGMAFLYPRAQLLA